MPLTLGLAGAGKAASALGGSGKGGPTSRLTQVGTNVSNTTGTSGGLQSGTSTPSLNPLMEGFQSSLVPALSSLFSQAQKPVYGAQQIAQVANQGDAATKAASDALTSNLARRGVLNSGAAASGNTALEQGNEANTVNFENQIPLLNYQNEMGQTQNVLGLAEGLTGKALATNVNTGTNSNTFSQNGTNLTNNTASQYGPGFGAGLLNGFGNTLTGASGIMANGGGKSGGAGKGGGGNPYGMPLADFVD